MSVHISAYIMYTVCNRRYTGRYMEGVYTEFYTCARIPYMSVHISVYIMYTVCTGGILRGMWKVCIRKFTLLAGFLICQYTFQHTSCTLCVTGGILGGMWKMCIRNFTVVLGLLLVQATCQYTVCILGKSRGILNVVWKESVLFLYTVYLVNNDPWFSVEMKFVFRTLSDRVFRNTNIRFENAR